MPSPRLHPPLPLMRPSPAETIPAEHGLPGGVQYSVKLDGIRCAAFALPDAPVLQSRGGHNRAPDFPAITSAIARLPAGTVLDGELCAWNTTEQRFAFEALLRSRRAREAADDIAVSYVAFDLLAAPHDLRELPLRSRWDMLQAVLAGTGPPLQAVMATTDRATALEWFDTLVPLGVEGVVLNSLLNVRVDAVQEGGVWCQGGVCTGCRRGVSSMRRGCRLWTAGRTWRSARRVRVFARERQFYCRPTARQTGG